MYRTVIRNRIFMIIVSVMALIIINTISGEAAYASDWPSFRGNDNNNGIVKYETPIEQTRTEPVWVRQFGDPASGMSGWSYAPNTPIIVDGEIFTTSSKTIQRINMSTGSTKKQGELNFSVNWGYTPLTYKEVNDEQGVIFCPLAGGSIEAVDRDTLEELWTFSMATVSMRAGHSGEYSYFNNRLFVTGDMAEKYYPDLKGRDCIGVSYADALVAAHIDKYGAEGLKDNLKISYNAARGRVEVTKAFGSSADAQFYNRNKLVTDVSSNRVQNGYDLFVRDGNADLLGAADTFEIIQGTGRNSDTAAVSFKLYGKTEPDISGKSSGIRPMDVSMSFYDPETGVRTPCSDASYDSTTGKVTVTLKKGVYWLAAEGNCLDSTGSRKFSDGLTKVMVYTDDIDRSSYEYDMSSAVHQSVTPIVYSDGMIYTGFYKGYDQYDYYVCINAATGELVWKYLSPGGFYWNGAVAVGDAIIVGTQDGINNNDVTGASGGPSADSRILSLDKKTGEIISEYTLPNASDICSSIVYDEEGTGRLFWTACGGYICSAAVDPATGALSEVKQEKIPGKQSLSVSTPVVYNGRVYFGYACKEAKGRLGVFRASNLREIFSVDMDQYSKSSPLITTAYEEKTGYLYIYMAQYNPPGGVTVIRMWNEATDAESEKDVKVSELFAANGYSEYGADSLIADNRGRLYYKNDSNSIFAMGKCDEVVLGRVEGLSVTPAGKKVTVKYTKKKKATSYRILYRINETGSFKRVDTKKTKYVLKGTNPRVVTVRVRPEYEDAAKTVYGDYSSDITVYSAKSTIKKLTAGKNAFTVEFDKHKICDGYQIQYSQMKNFSIPYTLTKKGYSTVKYKVTGLMSGKTYYVRVRSYKTVGKVKQNGKWTGGVVQYGNWSKKKSVKIK